MNGAPPPRGRSLGRILLIVFGSLALLVSLGLLAGGGVLLWADRSQRDAQGYLSSGLERVDSAAYAVVARDLMVEVPAWATGPDRLGSVRVSVTPTQGGVPMFVGIASRSDADAYLSGVARDQVTSWPGRTSPGLGYVSGSAPATPPGAQSFWVASSSGAGTQTVAWEVRGGDWTVVAMNADASRGLAFDVRAAATIPLLLPLSAGMLALGFVVLLLAVLMLVLGSRAGGSAAVAPAWGPTGGVAAPPPIAGVPAQPQYSVYPVAVQARLEEPLSRWLWLVKWLLALPHYIVLSLLGVAYAVLTLVAFFCILATGRYPRSIFDFNVGVLRWGWRVAYYSYWALGTDRYPPFSLGEEPDYPARLDVAFPEHLSRGLVLVKSWLLAIPHLLLVGLFIGGGVWFGAPEVSGLVGLLVLVAAVMLLVSSHYPRPLFDLAMAFDRWVLRVIVYVSLMRDEYPPFRIDTGGDEPRPDMAPTQAPPPMQPRPLGT